VGRLRTRFTLAPMDTSTRATFENPFLHALCSGFWMSVG
jgi:hypothetical protein